MSYNYFMVINGFQKTTLLDYPGHVAATVFTGGCNMRCPFCHNASLVLNPENTISEKETLLYIIRRRHIYDGICITGGEPTLNKDLPEFIMQIKNAGLKVKLDTNGLMPGALITLIDGHLIDYIAMDIKSSIENYGTACGIWDVNTDNILKSIDIIRNSNLPYEFRTTLVKGIHTYEEMEDIAETIKGAKAYFLQSYKDSGDIIISKQNDDNLTLSSFSEDELGRFLAIAKSKIPSASLRGIS